MALTLKNAQVESLANEVAGLTGESKTEAVRKALIERRDRIQLLQGGAAKRDLRRFLEAHIWPAIPAKARGRTVTKAEVEEYLGFGPGGV
jgi:antitoxin VapB